VPTRAYACYAISIPKKLHDYHISYPKIHHQIMTWEQTVQAKRAAREEALIAVLDGLPLDVADPFDSQELHAQTLISRLAAGEITAESVTTKAIHKFVCSKSLKGARLIQSSYLQCYNCSTRRKFGLRVPIPCWT
jgi:hypothetical protein